MCPWSIHRFIQADTIQYIQYVLMKMDTYTYIHIYQCICVCIVCIFFILYVSSGISCAYLCYIVCIACIFCSQKCKSADMHNIHTIYTYTYKIHTNILKIHTKIHANTCTYMHFDLGVGQCISYVCACISWAMHMCMYVCCMCMYLCVSVCMCVKYTTCAYALQMCICTPAGGSKVHPLRHSWAFHTPFALSNPVPSPCWDDLCI